MRGAGYATWKEPQVKKVTRDKELSLAVRKSAKEKRDKRWGWRGKQETGHDGPHVGARNCPVHDRNHRRGQT